MKRRHAPVEVPMPVSGVYVLESHHSASFRMEMGRWPFYKLCWVPVGGGSLEFEKSRITLDTNSIVIIPVGQTHRFVDDPSAPMTLIIACVTAHVLEKDESLAAIFATLLDRLSLEEPIRARSAFHFSGIRDCFQSMLREQSRGAIGHSAMLQSLLAKLVVSLVRGAESGGVIARTPERALDGLLDELESRFDKHVSLDEVAARCGVSSRRFTQLFKERTGYTLVDYINRKRIEFAKERLRETGHVAYACHESGYQDMAYFYRAFKRYVGCTPGEYVKRLK